MATVTTGTTTLPSAYEWKDLLDYAEGRIPEDWIVNPLTETITVLRLLDDAYEEAGVYRRGESAASVLLAGFSVDVAAVFEAD